METEKMFVIGIGVLAIGAGLYAGRKVRETEKELQEFQKKIEADRIKMSNDLHELRTKHPTLFSE